MNVRKKTVVVVGIVLLMVLSATLVSAEGPAPYHELLPPDQPGGNLGMLYSAEAPLEKSFSGQFSPLTMSSADTLVLGDPGFSIQYIGDIGISEQAYTPLVGYLNHPDGLFIDGSDNIYVTEERGCRALRYSSLAENTLSLGVAGLCYTDVNGNVFSEPRDIALDGSGNIWVADAYHLLVQYDPSGNFLQTFPAEFPQYSGSDNDRFDNVMGVAFDSGGRMYVADRWNHRVQVYTFSGSDPVYQTTIGETGVSGSDNSHFNEPWHLAIDSSDQLFVVDRSNHRIQRCTEGGSYTWSCSTFDSGLNYPGGVGLDSSDNVYISDSGNARIRKCTSGGSCSDLVTGFPGWVADVAVDSSGNVFATDWDKQVVRKYNSSGVDQGVFLGDENHPYVDDTARLYTPFGLGLSGDGAIYVTEKWGYSLLKYNTAGSYQWSLGIPGMWGDDNVHFGAFWAGPEGSVAVDAAGKVYVPDMPNNRIQIFTSGSVYDSTFGSYGTGNSQFDGPSAVAIHPTTGDIFVADRWNHRVQVYDSSWTYLATLGTTGSPGSTSSQFNGPSGLAVSSSGLVYVADSDNQRVQVCTVVGSGGTCSTFAGEANVSGFDFEHFSYPCGLALDGDGRVYVVDRYNNRVQIYDSTGAYLTTIGGEWGEATGLLRNPADVAVAADGMIYVSDMSNHRVQIYEPGVEGWEQTNINGFGDIGNGGVIALASFNSNLYAGTHNPGGGQIWRSPDGESWSQMMSGGFGSSDNSYIDHLYAYGGNLYAGTYDEDPASGADIYRSADGSTWNPITTDGFGDTINAEAFHFIEYGGNLYVSTWSRDTAVHGGEVWRSPSGDAGSWSRVIADGLGDSNNSVFASFAEHNGYLYAGSGNQVAGGEIWRSASGDSGTWTQVNTNGFGDAGNSFVGSMAVYDGYLYAITHHAAGDSSDLWRCQTCDGSDWVLWITGFHDQDSRTMPGLEVMGDNMYAVVGNWANGMEVWRGLKAYAWNQIGYAGFGDSSNFATYNGNATAVFNDQLYIGTFNRANGGELWHLLIPEIALSGNGQPIANGDSSPSVSDGTDFGDVAVGTPSSAHSFSIENTGEGKLYLPDTPKVQVLGANPGDFIVTSSPANPVNPGDSTTFEITFTPGAEGLRSAQISIENDDNDENPYVFDIQGTGTPPAGDPDNVGFYVPGNYRWYLKTNTADGWSGVVSFGWGGVSELMPVTGDWDGDGVDTAAFYKPSQWRWYIKNAHTDGWSGVSTFQWGGVAEMIPIAGDWDGDGDDTVGFYKPSTAEWYLKDDNTGGWTGFTKVIWGGAAGNIPIAGDWDGDGYDTIGFYVPSQNRWWLKNNLTDGWTGVTGVNFGTADPMDPVAGDWDGDGDSTMGGYVPSKWSWFLKDDQVDGWSNVFRIRFGVTAGYEVLAGDWQ